jgi:hypothetical protein
MFATINSVGDQDFIGEGTSSNNFRRNTLVIPHACTTQRLTFSIRTLAAAVPYAATLWVNNAPTILTATIVNGSLTYSAQGVGAVQLNTFDLISVQITYVGGALSEGACVTLEVV